MLRQYLNVRFFDYGAVVPRRSYLRQSNRRIFVPGILAAHNSARFFSMDAEALSPNVDSTLLEQLQQLAISEEDHELVEALLAISKNSPKLIRSSIYQAPAEPSIQIRSWKMNEFKYYDIPSPFPTLARGLFTQTIGAGDSARHKIVVRGYDKFFNIGEVPWTTWASLESHTKPPYTLTLKSNGCIIFMAALTPTKLLVTSKHSLGAIKGSETESHAQVGERWLRKHLADAGKTEEQLAAVLWAKKWTAIAELCDDSFEEHVLPYSKEQTGLHLHGINECSKHFKTMLSDVVEAFAEEWGFIVTPSMEFKTISEVQQFTEQTAKEGKWRGQAVEGFVVRTHVSEPPSKGAKDLQASPYAPGSSFFFKVKFDEPYMMYRDWREVTKTLLSKGPAIGNVPKGKMRRPETQVYVKWVIGEMKRDREQFADFQRGKGIIATRERFLQWYDSDAGRREREQTAIREAVEEQEIQEKFGKTIIVPVAVPGVGKTTISVALANLFGFGHTQSDDVPGKKPGPRFVSNVVKLLEKHQVVIADKNNHLRQHRQALREATKDMAPPVRLLAMNWSFELPLSTIHSICGERIVSRGNNHQTLHADTESKQHEEVIWMFLQNAEELLDNEVDGSIEMDVGESLEDALARAVDGCVRILGVPKPSAERIGQALAAARKYAPETTRQVKKVDKAKRPRYYALLPEINLERLLTRCMKNEDVPSTGKDFYHGLLENKRIADRPHITLVHEKGLPTDQPLWDRCHHIFVSSQPPLFTFKLSHVVWNHRIMAIAISDLAVCSDVQDPETKGAELVIGLPEELKGRMHVTVGTTDGSVNPVEARDLVLQWRQDRESVESCALGDVWAKGRIKGLFS